MTDGNLDILVRGKRLKLILIRSEEDNEKALRMISDLMDLQPEEGSYEFDLLDAQITLVEAYEKKHYPIGKPSLWHKILFHLDRLGFPAYKVEEFFWPIKRE